MDWRITVILRLDWDHARETCRYSGLASAADIHTVCSPGQEMTPLDRNHPVSTRRPRPRTRRNMHRCIILLPATWHPSARRRGLQGRTTAPGPSRRPWLHASTTSGVSALQRTSVGAHQKKFPMANRRSSAEHYDGIGRHIKLGEQSIPWDLQGPLVPSILFRLICRASGSGGWPSTTPPLCSVPSISSY